MLRAVGFPRNAPHPGAKLDSQNILIATAASKPSIAALGTPPPPPPSPSGIVEAGYETGFAVSGAVRETLINLTPCQRMLAISVTLRSKLVSLRKYHIKVALIGPATVGEFSIE
jgi:hypothetical protein